MNEWILEKGRKQVVKSFTMNGTYQVSIMLRQQETKRNNGIFLPSLVCHDTHLENRWKLMLTKSGHDSIEDGKKTKVIMDSKQKVVEIKNWSNLLRSIQMTHQIWNTGDCLLFLYMWVWVCVWKWLNFSVEKHPTKSFACIQCWFPINLCMANRLRCDKIENSYQASQPVSKQKAISLKCLNRNRNVIITNGTHIEWKQVTQFMTGNSMCNFIVKT